MTSMTDALEFQIDLKLFVQGLAQFLEKRHLTCKVIELQNHVNNEYHYKTLKS